MTQIVRTERVMELAHRFLGNYAGEITDPLWLGAQGIFVEWPGHFAASAFQDAGCNSPYRDKSTGTFRGPRVERKNEHFGDREGCPRTCVGLETGPICACRSS